MSKKLDVIEFKLNTKLDDKLPYMSCEAIDIYINEKNLLNSIYKQEKRFLESKMSFLKGRGVEKPAKVLYSGRHPGDLVYDLIPSDYNDIESYISIYNWYCDYRYAMWVTSVSTQNNTVVWKDFGSRRLWMPITKTEFWDGFLGSGVDYSKYGDGIDDYQLLFEFDKKQYCNAVANLMHYYFGRGYEHYQPYEYTKVMRQFINRYFINNQYIDAVAFDEQFNPHKKRNRKRYKF